MPKFKQLSLSFGRIGRRSAVTAVLVMFALVLMLVTALVLTAVDEVANHANTLDDDRSEETTRGALKTFRQQLGATLNDYAAWDDAAAYTYAPDGQDWMVSNFGDMTADSALFDVAIVIDRNNAPVLAYRQGKVMTAALTDYFDAAVWTLVENARRGWPDGERQQTGYVRTQDGISVVGAALIRKKLGALDVPVGEHRWLIFARNLGVTTVDALASTYVIPGLQLRPASEESPFSVAIPDPLGKVLGRVIWTSRSPGDMSFARVRPLVLAAVAIVGVFFVFLLVLGTTALQRLKAEEAMAREVSRRDRLSGLLNREGLHGELGSLIEQAAQDRTDVLLLYLDLDGFKEVNDTYGHGTGDQLIRAVSAGLKVLMPEHAMLARIGGDEFAIAVISGVASPMATTLSDLILHFFAEPFSLGQRMATVGASIGVASSAMGTTGYEELVRQADTAMYKAKESGRGRMVVYDPAMDANREEHNALELELRHAIDTGAINVVFQPVVDAVGYRMTGVEALARWSRPGGRSVPPDVFIPIAEKTGIIDQLGLLILKMTCEEGVRWPDLHLAINISPVQFRNPAFADNVAAVIRDSGVEPSRITLEVTEGYFIQNPARARHAIDRLKVIGVQIALDDFGAGFSSIGYLRQFGFDRMKVDRSLILALDENPRAQDMLQATVALARSLDIPVTAEGIEREDQALILSLCGCDQLQGYLFSKPVPASQIDRMIDGGTARSRQAIAG